MNLIAKLYAQAPSLALALERFRNDDFRPAERLWFDKIERRRSAISVEDSNWDVVDYGAGNKTLNLSEGQMSGGRKVTVKSGDLCARVSNGPAWCRLLFSIIRAQKPRACIELGSCVGISGAYQAAALKLNRRGRLITIEGAEMLSIIANDTFSDLRLANVAVLHGRFSDCLGPLLRLDRLIDYVFLDGHHSEKGTMGYFKQLQPFLSESAIVVIDDINWSAGMARAWQAIKSLSNVRIAIDTPKLGICVCSRYQL